MDLSQHRKKNPLTLFTFIRYTALVCCTEEALLICRHGLAGRVHAPHKGAATATADLALLLSFNVNFLELCRSFPVGTNGSLERINYERMA